MAKKWVAGPGGVPVTSLILFAADINRPIVMSQTLHLICTIPFVMRLREGR